MSLIFGYRFNLVDVVFTALTCVLMVNEHYMLGLVSLTAMPILSTLGKIATTES